MYQSGYSGKTLQINPTGQTVNKAELPLEIFQNFIGDAEFEIKDLTNIRQVRVHQLRIIP
jgi:hypothetical protein